MWKNEEKRGDWKPQLQITKKLKKHILKLLECHFPTEANSDPQAPRRAGLDHILAGQGCQDRSPGRGQVGAAPYSSSAIPGSRALGEGGRSGQVLRPEPR